MNIDNIESTKKGSEVKVERDENGKIQKYHITSYKRDNVPFATSLSRDEMETLMSMYSRYGVNLSKAAISPEFGDLTTEDLERVINALAIYKYDLPFAQHQIEELDEDELLSFYRDTVKKKLVKKLEKTATEVELAVTKKLLKQTQEELLNKRTLEETLTDIKIEVPEIRSFNYTVFPKQNKSLMLHLSDLHVGAKVQSDCIYPNPYDKDEIHRRLNAILNNVEKMGPFDDIILNELGDCIDGIDQQTARRDHIMPQCMDNKEQAQVFMQEMMWFIGSLRSYANKLKVYMVPNGNHGGDPEFYLRQALQIGVQLNYPDVECLLSKDFLSSYEYKGHVFILCHGKDGSFMKKPMPKYLDDKTQNFLNNWIRKNNIFGDNIHVVKGDLHSDNFDACEAFTYRNVLSLFGASDYSAYNYTPNHYGVSYELFINDNMLSGTFVDL